jgi:hypothetical protein
MILKVKEEFSEFCSSRKIKDFRQTVVLAHQDGSNFVLANAAVWRSSCTRFIGVSTEHCGDLLFYIDDLHSWSIYERNG